MKTIEELKSTFLFLLRQGLWGKTEDENTFFPISTEEWQTIYKWARKHVVHGIVYDGMLALSKEFYPPKSLLIQWMTAVDQRERITKAQIQLLCSLKHFYNQEPAISFELIKGLAIGCYYPQPLHRFSGDLDFYFGNPEKVELATQRLEKVGIPIKRGQLNDSAANINHLVVENHPILIELHNPFLIKKLRRWEASVFCKVEANLRPEYLELPIDVPTPVAHQLLVLTHILKHMLNEGIGLRQLCDAAILLRSQHKFIDSQELENLCKQFGVFHWTKALYALLVKFLGLPKECLPFLSSINPDDLMEEIWESGDFGFYDERKDARPEGKWGNKWYTVKQITRKASLIVRYAPAEAFWWPTTLAYKRLKELIIPYEKTNRKDTL